MKTNLATFPNLVCYVCPKCKSHCNAEIFYMWKHNFTKEIKEIKAYWERQDALKYADKKWILWAIPKFVIACYEEILGQ